ncbi:MAG: hypothetical protein WBW55_13090 [Desulfobaccales bacterium]
MKIISLIGVILAMAVGLAFSGCANVDHRVVIDTDKTNSFAAGQYSDSRSGQMGGWGFWVFGGGAGDTFPSWSPWSVKQADSDPERFARAIAMINYSKRLSAIRYDQTGGVLEYDFNQAPTGRQSRAPLTSGEGGLSQSFGHQPVE